MKNKTKKNHSILLSPVNISPEYGITRAVLNNRKKYRGEENEIGTDSITISYHLEAKVNSRKRSALFLKSG